MRVPEWSQTSAKNWRKTQVDLKSESENSLRKTKTGKSFSCDGDETFKKDSWENPWSCNTQIGENCMGQNGDHAKEAGRRTKQRYFCCCCWGEKGRNADGVRTNADEEDMKRHCGGTSIWFNMIFCCVCVCAMVRASAFDIELWKNSRGVTFRFS